MNLPTPLPPELSLARFAANIWTTEATNARIDLAGFAPKAPLSERLAWAKSKGLEIALVLARFSSNMQHSTDAQVRDNLTWAAQHGFYVPPEFVCVDEGGSGRKVRREGLNKAKQILKEKLATTLIVFKVSRLFRSAYRGFQFFQEEVVDEGRRGVSISQGIDTADHKTWKQLMYMHGIMDEMLLTTIAEHVYSGIKDMFLKGYVTGALPVGYYGKELPDAPRTNQDKVRKAPAVNREVAKLIVQHYEWIRDGMSIKEGWRRWVAANGPRDPRSTLDHMHYRAYRRMLSNPRYRGLWAFGRKQTVWSNKSDYAKQVERPESDVKIVQCEELRIVSDELFFAVQKRLAYKKGWGGPKKGGPKTLADLVVRYFYCAACKERFYQAAGGGRAMHCKRGQICPCKLTIQRQRAVDAVCTALQQKLLADAQLLEDILVRTADVGDEARAELANRRNSLNAKIQSVENRINFLIEMAGESAVGDRDSMKAKVKAAQAEKAELESRLASVVRTLSGTAVPITAEVVREAISHLQQLLEDGASGKLGEDLVHRAAAVFGELVGGKVWGHYIPRPGRKRGYVRGEFTPDLLTPTQAAVGAGMSLEPRKADAILVWLRPVPQIDQHAETAHRLIDIEGLSFRDAEKVMKDRGFNFNSGKLWQFYARYYETIGQPMPKRPYNNGRPAKPRE